MTKKDYELIASVLRQAKYVNKTSADTKVWERICLLHASALGTTNPRFDRDKFLKACGVVGYECPECHNTFNSNVDLDGHYQLAH